MKKIIDIDLYNFSNLVSSAKVTLNYKYGNKLDELDKILLEAVLYDYLAKELKEIVDELHTQFTNRIMQENKSCKLKRIK